MLIVPFIALLRGLSNYLQILLVNKTALNIVGDLQKKIYEKIIQSNIEIIEDNGDMILDVVIDNIDLMQLNKKYKINLEDFINN